MKANVDFPKKAKNSFIYFQVGLIATMVVVLFILEFNFQNKTRRVTFNDPIEIISEPTFVYNPAPVTKQVEVTKPVVVKVTRVAHVFKPTKEEPKKEDNNTQLATQDGPKDANLDPIPTEVPTNTAKKEEPTDLTALSVEQLPMFHACKGLDRTEQKACFDQQLAKAVVKHLTYPESDIKYGKQGIAQVEFVIDEKGVISDVRAIDNNRATPDMQLAAEKAVRKIPKLIPAKQGNKAVKIKYSIPVVFRMK